MEPIHTTALTLLAALVAGAMLFATGACWGGWVVQRSRAGQSIVPAVPSFRRMKVGPQVNGDAPKGPPTFKVKA